MIAAHLREHGFTVDAVQSGGEAQEAAGVADYDAAVLDLGLPDMDGLDVLRGLRSRRPAMPVLILTARDHVDHRIAGLDAGADDYILKPFELRELEARLRAVLRRPGQRETPHFSFGDLGFDPVGRLASVGGRSMDLTRREGMLFETLIRNGDRVVVRDALADSLYGFADDVSSNALEATVSRVRRKLALLQSSVRVEPVRGIGYRLALTGDAR